jgi:heat shock protein HslJ
MPNKINIFRKIILPTAFLLMGLALAACGGLGLSPLQLTDTEWQWVSVTEASTREIVEIPNPENYTITFREDGTFSGMADCNAIQGTYTVPEEGEIEIQLGPTTLAFCGDASLDQLYLGLLDGVVAGAPDSDRNLALETAGGAQRMTFEDSGAADS